MMSAPENRVFDVVADMESPLQTVRLLTRAVAMIAETIDPTEDGNTLQCLAWLALEEVQELETKRGEAFRLTHPRRAHFEAEGWP